MLVMKYEFVNIKGYDVEKAQRVGFLSGILLKKHTLILILQI